MIVRFGTSKAQLSLAKIASANTLFHEPEKPYK
jgi:hypothetical protein